MSQVQCEASDKFQKLRLNERILPIEQKLTEFQTAGYLSADSAKMVVSTLRDCIGSINSAVDDIRRKFEIFDDYEKGLTGTKKQAFKDQVSKEFSDGLNNVSTLKNKGQNYEALGQLRKVIGDIVDKTCSPAETNKTSQSATTDNKPASTPLPKRPLETKQGIKDRIDALPTPSAQIAEYEKALTQAEENTKVVTKRREEFKLAGVADYSLSNPQITAENKSRNDAINQWAEAKKLATDPSADQDLRLLRLTAAFDFHPFITIPPIYKQK